MQPNGRRDRGNGSLSQRPASGGRRKWIAQWRIDGRGVTRVLGLVKARPYTDGLTYDQANEAFKVARAEAEAARLLKPERTKEDFTLADAVEGLLRDKRRMRKAATIEAIESTGRVHIKPFFPEPVHEITVKRVAAFRDHLLDDKALAPKSVANILGTLHGLFDYAIKHKWYLAGNPVKEVESPKSNETTTNYLPRDRYLIPEEVEKLLRAVPDTAVGHVDRVMYLMAARTGLRQGELLALRWCDIDWTRRIVHVHRNYVRDNFQTPKSGKGRSVPLTPQVLRELELLHQDSNWQGDDDLVFAHPETGKPMERSRLLKRFKAALLAARVGRIETVLDEAGEEKRKPVVDPRTNRWLRDERGEPITEPVERPVFRFHDLRHTFGTQLVSEGMSLRKVQEWMGHAEMHTTMIYSHFMGGAEDAEKIAAAFGEAKLAEPEETPTSGLGVWVTDDPVERIARLADLHERGLLEADEFVALKSSLLAKLAA